MKNNEKIETHVLDKYTILKKLGSGAYGHVWKAQSKPNGTVVALKKIFDAFQHSTDAQRTFREISILRQLRHDKIIDLVEVIPARNNEDIYLVFSYMESDLYHMIYEGKLQAVHVKYLMYQIVLGLHYLHASKLIHRDLKPSNILINSDCSVKICDFGLVRYLENEVVDTQALTEGVATRWYRAPEVLLGSNSYDTKADMWSLGCILAEILLKNPMFPGNCTTNQLERILQFTGQPSASDIKSLHTELGEIMVSQVAAKARSKTDIFQKVDDKQAISLVERLLSFNPNKRPDTSEALKHPYFADFYDPKDQIVKRTPIHMEVSESVKLDSSEYLAIIKQRYAVVPAQASRSKSKKRERLSESPKSFSDLRKSRLSSNQGSSNKPSAAKKDSSFDKSTNLFKELCSGKSASKERKKPSESLNKENEGTNKAKSAFSSFHLMGKGQKAVSDKSALGGFSGLRKTSKLNRG